MVGYNPLTIAMFGTAVVLGTIGMIGHFTQERTRAPSYVEANNCQLVKESFTGKVLDRRRLEVRKEYQCPNGLGVRVIYE